MIRSSPRSLRRDAAQPAAHCATMLGMAWGIATVVMLLAYGDGFGQAMRQHFRQLRNQTGDRGAGVTSMQAGRSEGGSCRFRFTQEDVERIANQPSADHAALRRKSASRRTCSTRIVYFTFPVERKQSQRV